MKTSYESRQIQPAHEIRKRCKTELVRWLNTFEFDYFFTLTFKRDVSKGEAEKALRHFYNLLSDRAFGRHQRRKRGSDRGVSLIPSMERQSGGRIHWHVLMQKLHWSSRLREDFKAEVRECWRKCGGSTVQFDFKNINRDTQEKLIDYTFKEVAYDTDSFYSDWLVRQK